jgi:hypothetical protein
VEDPVQLGHWERWRVLFWIKQKEWEFIRQTFPGHLIGKTFWTSSILLCQFTLDSVLILFLFLSYNSLLACFSCATKNTSSCPDSRFERAAVPPLNWQIEWHFLAETLNWIWNERCFEFAKGKSPRMVIRLAIVSWKCKEVNLSIGYCSKILTVRQLVLVTSHSYEMIDKRLDFNSGGTNEAETKTGSR